MAIMFLVSCWVVLLVLIAAEGSPSKVVRMKVVRMKCTAYCPCVTCCGKGARGITSTGKDAKTPPFGVAADPKLLPYGTKLEIPGIGVREVDDTGGAMRKDARKGIYHIDLRFVAHQEALEFGIQWLDVKILPKQQARSR